jgi:rhodanese-related sulfurtransferase
MRKMVFFWMGVLALASCVSSQEINDISSAEAFNLLKEPNTYLIDVRSIAEYVFVGHPVMAHNIPLNFWDEESQDFISNKTFLEDLKARLKTEDRLIFICRSGGRSLRAARMAQNAGFMNVFNITLGFEGEKNVEGYRVVNGWKNSLPYTYELDDKLIYRH